MSWRVGGGREALLSWGVTPVKTFQIRECLGASALSLALTVAASGCGSSVPVGGITNPNAGSIVDRDKQAVRTDMNVTDLNAAQKEPIADEAAKIPAGAGVMSGPGSGTVQGSPEAASSAPATPAAKENAGEASGGTRPSGPIKAGTPTSPQ